jgi:hypothetical protein
MNSVVVRIPPVVPVLNNGWRGEKEKQPT